MLNMYVSARKLSASKMPPSRGPLAPSEGGDDGGDNIREELRAVQEAIMQSPPASKRRANLEAKERSIERRMQVGADVGDVSLCGDLGKLSRCKRRIS